MRRFVTIAVCIIPLCGVAVSASAKGGGGGGIGCASHAVGHAGGAGPAGANGRAPTTTYYCQPGVCQSSDSVRPRPP
jgi:hypothetical protein